MPQPTIQNNLKVVGTPGSLNNLKVVGTPEGSNNLEVVGTPESGAGLSRWSELLRPYGLRPEAQIPLGLSPEVKSNGQKKNNEI